MPTNHSTRGMNTNPCIKNKKKVFAYSSNDRNSSRTNTLICITPVIRIKAFYTYTYIPALVIFCLQMM